MIVLLACSVLSWQSVYSSPEGSILSVKNGVFDLRNWNPDRKNIIQLDGTWKFEPGINHPSDKLFSDSIQVPGAWNKSLHFHNLANGLGTGTYEVKILLPENLNKTLALQFHDTSTAFRIFANGVEIYENGKLGLSREEMTPSYKHPIVLLGDISKEIDLRIEVSNFYHATGGLRKSIELGSVPSIIFSQRVNNAIDWVLFSASFLMGIYHLVIFFMRRIDKSALWFGFFCVGISLRSFFTGTVIAYEIFDDKYWTIIHKMDIMSYIIAIPLFTLYAYRVFQQDFHQRIVHSISGISIIFITLVVALPSDVYMRIIPYYQILTVLLILYVLFIIGKVLKTNRDGAWLFFSGALILFSTAINDMLNQALIIESYYLVNWGLLAFLFCQASLLSSLYTKAFNKMEDAQILLEKAVRSRTQELELATKEAEESNLLKDKYFTHLTHDLKTPITNVIRSLNRIIKDYNTLDDESKITFINQAKLSSKESLNMIGILLNINQLRTNLTQIKLEEVNLFREVNSAINLHWDYIKSKKIAIHNLLVVDLKVYSDKILIQEVLSNLISNSIKISKSAGKINISTEEQELSLIVMIEVFEVGVDESILGNFPNSEIQTSRTSASGDIGVGLGILLVKDIIQSWKGTLAIDSKIGEGTKFSFTIPKLD